MKQAKDSSDSSSRLSEIRKVLSDNHITRGITPEKLRVILEELGPTYVKLGQIMALHSDVLPERYCRELMKLESGVKPMPFSDVEDVLRETYGCDWHDCFSRIDEMPLGSASIAQVHRARLASAGPEDGDVIIKVQRKGIYDTMARDIRLMHRAVKFLPPVGDMKRLVDFDMVLDEMWTVAQEEMNFLHEESNMLEFARNNRDVRYVRCPKLYEQYSSSKVLVMEYIDGCAISDVETLRSWGYDLDEIGRKFVNNFIRQVMDDGFFHADPHPGNVKICDGRIVWIDMGMMGRLTDRDRRIMVEGVRGIAMHDLDRVEHAVLSLGDFRGKPDRNQLYADLRQFLADYGSASMGSINVAEMVTALMDIMKENRISLPHGMTMLCRGLTQMQGVLQTISPDVSMIEIATSRITEETLSSLDLRKEMARQGRKLWRAVDKGVEIPSLTTDIMKEYLAGQGRMNMTLHTSREFSSIINAAVRNIVIGLCIAALLIGSSILCMTDMRPRFFGIPLLGATGFLFAICVSAFLVIRNIYYKIRRRR